MTPCTAHGKGWACTRPARARGLCTGHLAQKARGRPLTPLRDRGSGLVPCPIRVSARVAERASKDPRGARAALEEWALASPPHNKPPRGAALL